MNWDRWIYGKAFTQRKFHNEAEREAWKKGFRQGFLDPLKTMGIRIVVVVIVSAAVAIGFGLEPFWVWVAFGAGGAFLITLPFTLWMMF